MTGLAARLPNWPAYPQPEWGAKRLSSACTACQMLVLNLYGDRGRSANPTGSLILNLYGGARRLTST